MAVYVCQMCGYEYDEDSEGVPWSELPEDWCCPMCEVDKSYFESTGENEAAVEESTNVEVPAEIELPEGTVSSADNAHSEYLSQWSKSSDSVEQSMADIHKIATTGKSLEEPMRTRKPLPSWDDIVFKGAQLFRVPLNAEDPVSTQTVIGGDSEKPMVLDIPLLVSHMSFGAISAEFKTAMAKGSAAVHTAICSGEGGILPAEKENAYKYIFEYVPNQYSVSEDALQEADAVEIKIGQAAKPGMGGHLPGEKVSAEVAQVRNRPEGESITSPAHFPDISSKEELKEKVDWLRKISGGRPVGVKIAAGHLEKDLEQIVFAEPDFITVDGRGGATGSARKAIKDSASLPTLYAVARARRFLEVQAADSGRKISLIVTGGIRTSGDMAKALALGADAVALATSIMIAGGCQQYKICNSGKCPVGIATQDPELRSRINEDISAERISNYLRVCAEEIQDFARICGKADVHLLDTGDLMTGNSEISDYLDLEHF